MSGPPPWTITGFMPTYLSSTTSVAKPSRSASSVIAAPPYLITTVRPWNSRMYGRASRRISIRGSVICSRRVVGVDADVLAGQVREVHMGAGVAALEGERDLRLG